MSKNMELIWVVLLVGATVMCWNNDFSIVFGTLAVALFIHLFVRFVSEEL